MNPLMPAGYDVLWSLMLGAPLVLTIALVVGAIVAVVIGLRALQRIDRSLRELVLQGVTRGDGPPPERPVA